MKLENKTVKSERITTIVYVVLRLLVIAILIRAIILGRWDQVFYCALALIEFMVPSFVEKKLRIELPSALEIIVLLFIFAGEILGEIGELFNKIQLWDVMLHTLNGFLMAAIGVALIDVFNKSPKISFSMAPFFVAFVAFCFSMTIGVLWEFTEYSLDRYMGFDMQKDTIVSSINSYELDPSRQSPVKISRITATEIKGTMNGQPADLTINGYIDVGLNDTMEDMFVNLVGASVFSVIAAFYIKRRGEGRGGVAGAFIPRMLNEDELSEMEGSKLTVKEKLKARFKV
ncbi:MAG: hypothetical protein QMB62_03290 [Oscillospiraceae bacterium]